jgi:hypothetical protein
VWRKLEIQWRKVEICWRKKINSLNPPETKKPGGANTPQLLDPTIENVFAGQAMHAPVPLLNVFGGHWAQAWPTIQYPVIRHLVVTTRWVLPSRVVNPAKFVSFP